MRDKRAPIADIAVKALLAGFFSVALMWRCAHPMAPQGGPRDTLPPVVAAMTPGYAAVNFTGKRIYIEFDEYVKLQDQQNEFYTSPLMGKPPVLTIRGRGVQIDLNDTLRQNTTYSLDFGTSLRDNNEGNILHNLRYVFSTGEKTDSMLMSGYTADAYTGDSLGKAFVYFYDAAADTLAIQPGYDSLLLLSRPDAVGRSNGNGIFIAENLKPIDYRVYAILDANNNKIYDPGTDKVAFADSICNPSAMPPFRLWYDTTRNYVVGDPQMLLRLFTDKPFQRQNLSKSERLQRHRIDLLFNSPHPIIDSLAFEGIDSARILTESSLHGDSLTLWLRVPPEELPDTIRGGIKYMRHDSVRVLVPHTQSLSLVWKEFESRDQRRERERRERERQRERELAAQQRGIPVDSVVLEPEPLPNPLRIDVSAGNIIPSDRLTINSNFPIESSDTSLISVIRIAEDNKLFRVRSTVSRDSVNSRRWYLAAPWQQGQKYRYIIPEGSFTDFLGHANDSISGEVNVQSAERFSTLVLNIKSPEPDKKYIVQVVSPTGDRVLRQKAHLGSGRHVFEYIEPGKVKIRVVEDLDDNGVWDSGDLVKRRQPERVGIYVTQSGIEEILMRENWELEEAMDMETIFAPVTMERLIEQIGRAEQQRLLLRQQEAAERERENGRRQEGTDDRPQNGFGGFGGGLGGGLGLGQTR